VSLQIIPVIDVMGGQVVQAIAGNRANYSPISSVVTSSTTPKGVIEDLLSFSDFEIVYIAELDSIQFGQLNIEFYSELFKQFPAITFWFDYGVSQKSDITKFSDLDNVKVVVGTETLQEPDVFSEAGLVLSLDFKNEKPLGLIQIHQQTESWPEDVIVMSLDNVGKQSGPNYQLIEFVASSNDQVNVYAAGGVRNKQDLEKLSKKGVKGVLIASALHHGKLDKDVINSVNESTTLQGE
jgi:phosphoribosylformimino-5-aminoimidazole carboxamide ribotide isomerase